MWQVATVNEAFLKVSGRGEKVVWRWQDKDDEWKPIVAAGMYGRVRALAIRLEREGPRGASPGRAAQGARWVAVAVEAA